MNAILQDMKFFARTMRRYRSFTIIAISILGLGIGAAITIFSVVNSVLLKPLPYPDPSRLVAITETFRQGTENRVSEMVSLDNLRNWQANSKTIESMGGSFFTHMPIRIRDVAYLPGTAFVNSGFFKTLGVRLAQGDVFPPGSHLGDAVIISHAFWLRAYGAAPNVVGSRIFVDGMPLTITGVLPADFEMPRPDARLYPGAIDIFMPPWPESSDRLFWGIARLRPDVSLEQAQAELRSIAAGLNNGNASDWTVSLTSLAAARKKQSASSLVTFLVVAMILLVIACVNLMNLFLSRSSERAHEMNIRKALGGSRGRLLRQQLTESFCLSVLGGVVGIGLAAIAVRYVEVLSPTRLPTTGGITIDGTVIGFGFSICILATIVAGLLPAFISSRRSVWPGRQSSSTSGTMSRTFSRLQGTLSFMQLALCVGLLAAAGVLLHSLWRLNTIDAGFDRADVLGFELTAPQEYVSRALAELRSLPGTDSVGYITFLPPEATAANFRQFTLDVPDSDPSGIRSQVANTVIASAGYFQTVGISIVRGRQFRDTDTEASSPVMIVNDAFVRNYLRGSEPVGQRVTSAFDSDGSSREIVGVVNDTRDRGFGNDPVPTIYLPFGQGALGYGAIALRSDNAEALIPEIRRRLSSIDQNVPLSNFQMLDDRVRESLKEPRFYASLATWCGFLAITFVSIGVFGVVSYSVSVRRLEFGVRMALGSTKVRVLLNVLGYGIKIALAGVTLGTILAVSATRLLRSLLFQVDPLDPVTLSASLLLVFAVTLIAAYVPARKACNQDPMAIIRYT